MKRKIIISFLIIIFIILIIIVYHTDDKSILNNLYQYPVSKNNIYKDYLYNSYSNHINIVTYNGNESNVEIPGYINNLPVQSIEDSAFYGNISLEEITIPNTVLKIGYQSFIGNENLRVVYIPKSVIYIGTSAFKNCPSLETIYVKKNSKAYEQLKDKGYLEYIKYY